MKPPAMKLSRAVEAIHGAKSIEINQIVYDLRRKGRDVITLSLGEAFFDLPLFDFNALDTSAVNHYSDSQGLPSLRVKIAEFYTKQYNAPVHPDEVIISAGSKPLIYMAMLAFVDRGDEVLIHEPAWLSYEEHIKLVGGLPRFIPYHIEPAEFPNYFTQRTRMLVLNNPNNPAGRVYTAEDLAFLYKECRSRGIYMLVDEAYSDFVCDGQFASTCAIAPDKDGVIVINSLSKNMGISGWRVGYAICNKQSLGALLKLNQHLITCPPTILCHYLAKYFDDVVALTLPQVAQAVENRAKIAHLMDEMKIDYLPGSSTFYFFVGLGDFPGTSDDFSRALLAEHAVSVVPGSAYGASTDRFIRLSVGVESIERIHEALHHIRNLSRATTFDRDRIDRLVQELRS